MVNVNVDHRLSGFNLHFAQTFFAKCSHIKVVDQRMGMKKKSKCKTEKKLNVLIALKFFFTHGQTEHQQMSAGQNAY